MDRWCEQPARNARAVRDKGGQQLEHEIIGRILIRPHDDIARLRIAGAVGNAFGNNADNGQYKAAQRREQHRAAADESAYPPRYPARYAHQKGGKHAAAQPAQHAAGQNGQPARPDRHGRIGVAEIGVVAHQAMAVTPEMTTQVSMVPLVRCSNERASSSIPNTIPASGVLKAAATPAAPPALIRA